ncbi:MAG TPA: cytochrome c [Bacteroidales bacterium]|nr:cytochrome c [Bacteroidales bacterium]
MKLKIIILNITAICLAVLIMSANLQHKPWVIPAKYKTLKNPVKMSSASTSAGKLTYDKHCKSCHGSTGKGDGVKAKTLKTHISDLGTTSVQTASDGEIYYKAFIGRDEAPNLEKKIPDETDRWNIVNFVRSLKK